MQTYAKESKSMQTINNLTKNHTHTGMVFSAEQLTQFARGLSRRHRFAHEEKARNPPPNQPVYNHGEKRGPLEHAAFHPTHTKHARKRHHAQFRLT